MNTTNPPTNLQWLASRPGVQTLLIANVVLFAIPFLMGPDGLTSVGLIPEAFFRKSLLGGLADLLRYQFFHVGFGHLSVNMLNLMLIGASLELSLGHWRFLTLYLVSGIFSGLAYALFMPEFQIPLVGASGAIGGVMGAALLLTREQPLFDLSLFTIKAKHILTVWILWQIYLLIQTIGYDRSGEFLVHIAGFATGLAVAWYWKDQMIDTAPTASS